MTTRKPKKPDTMPAHPDLIPGLERLGLPTMQEPGSGDVRYHPTYHEVLTEMLAKKVPA